jgi:hypothetical protein
MCIFCSSAGTLTTIAYAGFARTEYGDECDCHRLYVRLICWANFSFGEERTGLTHCLIYICMCMIELNFEEQIENKLEFNSNRKNKTRNVTPNSTGGNILIRD